MRLERAALSTSWRIDERVVCDECRAGATHLREQLAL
jgi:hypothetical protein